MFDFDLFICTFMSTEVLPLSSSGTNILLAVLQVGNRSPTDAAARFLNFLVIINSGFSSPKRPDGFFGPPNLLLNEYGGSFPRQSDRGVKLTTHLHLVPGVGISTAIPLSPIHLLGVSRDNFTFTFYLNNSGKYNESVFPWP
jgi:hypothetical protein